MRRFLGVLGILLATTLFFELDVGNDIRSIFQADNTEEHTGSVAVPVTRGGVAQLQLKRAIAPTTDAANRIAVKAMLVVVETQADEEYIAPSQTLSSAPQEITPVEIEMPITQLTPFEIKSAIQTELHRLSCYDAEIDGQWGGKSRKAVEVFNAKSDEAFDLEASGELLTALKSEPDKLCSTECPGLDSSCPVVAAIDESVMDPGGQEQVERPSYLPPWMTGTEQVEFEAEPEAELSERVTRPSYRAPRKHKVKKKRRSARVERKTKPRKATHWLPNGWPGAD